MKANSKISSKGAKKVERIANEKKVEIEWFTRTNFKVCLNQPKNLDLTQVYFGVGDEIGFIKNSFPSEIYTLLQSSEYISLPLKGQGTNNSIMTNELREKILSSKEKMFLITGHPGSGKSILMYKLFQEFGGLDKKDAKEMKRLINRNGAIPMLVNFKDCASDSLENIIRNRQKDFKIRRGNIKFIYLLDGLDEIGEERADNMLSDIQALEGDANTKKIIISSRLGTRNLAMLKVYQSKIAEYKINDLSSEYIDKFFEAKNNNEKVSKLNTLKRDNTQILANAKDILLIKLLWDTIDELDKYSTVVDLFNYKLKLLLSDPKHKKNLEELDIPNPKDEQIISLNKELAFNLQKEFRFSFSVDKLQDLVLNMFPRITYKSANAIIEYMAKLFFDYQDSENQKFYTYQHRTYQEFFLALKLKEEYEKNPAILRKLNILPNQTFFEELFLKYLEKAYKLEGNIIGLIELGVIKEYLSIDRYWGADKPYYINSIEFIPALASQNDLILGKLLEDENLQIMRKILIDTTKLNEKFRTYENKKDFDSESYLEDIYGSGILFLIRAIAIFWKNNKENVANKLIENLFEVMGIFEENKFIENFDEDRKRGLENQYWEEWENWIYFNFKILIEKENINQVFDKIIRGNYNKLQDKFDYIANKSLKEELIGPFIRICLRYRKEEFLNLIETFNEDEFLILLKVLSEIEFIPLIISDKLLQDKVKRFIKEYKARASDESDYIIFYKKLFADKLLPKEKEKIKSRMKKLLNDLSERINVNHEDLLLCALLSFTVDEFTFGDILKDIRKDFYAPALYASLFNSFIKLIRNKINVKEIFRDYILYVSTHRHGIYTIYEVKEKFFKKELSILWADIFYYSGARFEVLRALKNRLLTEENAIDFIAFANELNKMNKQLFSKLVNKTELQLKWNDITKESNDFHSYIDNCFLFASLFSGINENKSISYILKGINSGILRHGYRNDCIVSYWLVDALEILWRNNWLSKEELKENTKWVFKLTRIVSKITDGKGTWKGPSNLVELIAKYDISFAEKLKNDLMKDEDYYSINRAIRSVLLGKVNMGFSIEEIEKGMEEFKGQYEKPYSRDFFEKKFEIYLAMAQSELYTPNDRKESFTKAYLQVEEMKKQGIEYFLMDSEFRKQKEEFIKLCNKYGKKPNVSLEEKKDYELDKYPVISENDFLEKIKKAKTKEEIEEIYSQLRNHEKYIVLENSSTWELLVDKTFQILDNIQPFIELLKENYFPSMCYYSHYSKYFSYGVAAALKRNDTKVVMETYLLENGGHCSFLTMMNVYEAMNNKEMCLKLFQRYIKFCYFLVMNNEM